MGSTFIRKSFLEPEESDTSANRMTIDLVALGDTVFRRFTVQPGYRAAVELKAAFGSEMCPYAHTIVGVSGRGVFKMTDGSEHELGSWDVVQVDADHDFWTVGDEPCVWIELSTTPP